MLTALPLISILIPLSLQLVVKKSDPELILNGRAAMCAGRDDMTSEEEDEEDQKSANGHRFNNPNNFKFILESGGIPDAAMIHAARKSRQKAREQGDYLQDPHIHTQLFLI